MGATLLLDIASWDLVTDANVNVAAALEPYALAQDAASAIKLFEGEYYFDTTEGVPYETLVLGQNPSVALIKQQLAVAALTVPDTSTAKVFLSSLTDRELTGQVQVTPAAGGAPVAAGFSVLNPQGGG